MIQPQCCNKPAIEIQSGRVVSMSEPSRYAVWFCAECGECRVSGIYNNESFVIRISIPKQLMYEALNNAYQKGKGHETKTKS